MTAVLIIEGVAIVLLAILVVGLLRSNADVLRALHELGAGEPGAGSGRTRHQHAAPEREGVAPDVSGSTLSGSAFHVGVSGTTHPTLLAFLSTGCSACIGLWDGLATGVGRIGSEDTRLVVVTKGPEAESESRLRDLAPAGVALVQSTEAWTDYEVPVSPYFVLVDGPSGSVIGEGSAGSWAQVGSLMSQALADAGSSRPDFIDNGELRADDELRRAGIHPGDPSLYHDERPGNGTGERAMVKSAGIEVAVPQGWDAEIYRREGELTSQSGAAGASHPVVHVGTFPLPPGRGDFGSGAVEIMNQDDLLVVLFEYGRESVGSPLFARPGIPRVAAADFGPNNMQRPIAGQSGAQYFFNQAGRAFCLYVVLGSHARRNELIPEVNHVLAGLTIDPE